MSEAKDARIDPRFDPRFQRGYVPDAAAARRAPEPTEQKAPAAGAAAPPIVASPPPPAPPRVAPASTASGHVDPEGSPNAVASVLHGRAPAESVQVPEDEPALAALFGPSIGEESRGVAPWFIAGWGVAVVAAVVGAAVWWSSVLNQNFNGPVNGSDRWFQALGWMVAPSLIEAGLLGVVAMLVWTGVRHARRHEDRS